MVWNKVKSVCASLVSGAFTLLAILTYASMSAVKKLKNDFRGFIKDLLAFGLIYITGRYIVLNQSAIPEIIYIGSFLILSVLITITLQDEINLKYKFSFKTAVLAYLNGICTFRYLLSNNMYISSSGIMEHMIDFSSIIGGLILLIVTVMILSGIMLSILGIDSDELRAKRIDRIDDPYGDKHAQDILNNDKK